MRDWEEKGGGQDRRKGQGYGYNYISVSPYIFNGTALKSSLNSIFEKPVPIIDTFLQIFEEYQGEVDKKYGVSQEPLKEDERTMVFEKTLLTNIVDYCKQIIQKAKEEPDKHFILDLDWGVFDIDKLMDLTEEDLENYLTESRTMRSKALEKYKELKLISSIKDKGYINLSDWRNPLMTTEVRKQVLQYITYEMIGTRAEVDKHVICCTRGEKNMK